MAETDGAGTTDTVGGAEDVGALTTATVDGGEVAGGDGDAQLPRANAPRTEA